MNEVGIGHVERLNGQAGRHWFDADALRFFGSRTSETAVGYKGGWLMADVVASEYLQLWRDLGFDVGELIREG